MTEEQKDLLLKDICARLTYGVICDRLGEPKKLLGVHPTKKFPLELDNGEYMPSDYELEGIKPYLRPMSSMTKEEEYELSNYIAASMFASQNKNHLLQLTYEALYGDFFNKHHLDYRGLIPMGLALEASEGMYE